MPARWLRRPERTGKAHSTSACSPILGSSPWSRKTVPGGGGRRKRTKGVLIGGGAAGGVTAVGIGGGGGTNSPTNPTTPTTPAVDVTRFYGNYTIAASKITDTGCSFVPTFSGQLQ